MRRRNAMQTNLRCQKRKSFCWATGMLENLVNSNNFTLIKQSSNCSKLMSIWHSIQYAPNWPRLYLEQGWCCFSPGNKLKQFRDWSLAAAGVWPYSLLLVIKTTLTLIVACLQWSGWWSGERIGHGWNEMEGTTFLQTFLCKEGETLRGLWSQKSNCCNDHILLEIQELST